MREVSLAATLSGEQAATRLLSKLGFEGGDASPLITEQIGEQIAEQGSPLDGVLHALERHGVYGRFARVGKVDLNRIEVPTLLLLKDARWLLVVGIRRRAFVVEDATGSACSISHDAVTEAFDGCVFDRTTELAEGATIWSRVLRLMWAQRRNLYPAIALGLLAQGIAIAAPQLARALVDQAFPQASLQLLQAIIIGMVFVALFQTLFTWAERRVAQFFHIRLDAILERALLAHIMRLPFGYLERKSLGQLMQGFQGIGTCRSLLTGDALTAMLGGISALVLLAIMARTMPIPTLVVAGICIAAATVTIVLGHRQSRLQTHMVETQVREHEHAAEIFTHIAMIKAAGAEHHSVERWRTLLRDARMVGLRSERLSLSSDVIVGLLGQFQLQALWIWGGSRVIEGTLQLGELLAYTLMASACYSAVKNIARYSVTLWTTMPHLRETESLLRQPRLPAIRLGQAASSQATIQVRNVSFRYSEDRPWVFENFDLNVAPGELRYIDGPSGFGKTTLLKLVAGLYEPAAGNILVAGRSPSHVRDHLIYLPQFVRPFNASVLHNMRLFSGGVPVQRLMEAAHLTGLANFVDTLPMGYDTLLAQGGSNFSGGQRQLIALTAVLASDRPVLLLDEASANLDSLRWADLSGNPLLKGKTILCASHRVSEECAARIY